MFLMWLTQSALLYLVFSLWTPPIPFVLSRHGQTCRFSETWRSYLALSQMKWVPQKWHKNLHWSSLRRHLFLYCLMTVSCMTVSLGWLERLRQSLWTQDLGLIRRRRCTGMGLEIRRTFGKAIHQSPWPAAAPVTISVPAAGVTTDSTHWETSLWVCWEYLNVLSLICQVSAVIIYVDFIRKYRFIRCYVKSQFSLSVCWMWEELGRCEDLSDCGTSCE